MEHRGPGVLLDFSVARVLTGWDEGVDFTGEVTAIIGTPVFVAVSVLSGSFSSRFLGSCTHRSNMRWGEMAQVSDSPDSPEQ